MKIKLSPALTLAFTLIFFNAYSQDDSSNSFANAVNRNLILECNIHNSFSYLNAADRVPDYSQLLGYENNSDDWKYDNNKIKICHIWKKGCYVSKNALPARFNNHNDARGPYTSYDGSAMIDSSGKNSVSHNKLNSYLEVELLPNPATSEVSILLHGLEEVESVMSIYDQIGQLVQQQILEEGTHELNLDLTNTQFTHGVYFLSISTGNELITKSFFIN